MALFVFHAVIIRDRSIELTRLSLLKSPVVGVGGVTGVIGRLQDAVVPPLLPRQDQKELAEVSAVSENVPAVHWFRVVEQEPFTGFDAGGVIG